MIAGAIFILLGIMGILHQLLVAGVAWQWSQFWHHEPLIAIAFTAGLTLLVLSIFNRRRGK